MADREALIGLLRRRGHTRSQEPIKLASGELSHDYVDGKRAIADGNVLQQVCRAVVEIAADNATAFDAVGGLTMGADPIAHGVALLTGAAWFSVRKDRKRHGKQKLIEGAELLPGTRVLLVDDVVTTGGSILQALDAVVDTGASVVLAVALLDRGETARPRLEARDVRYAPLATYKDFRIDPVGRVSSATTPGR